MTVSPDKFYEVGGRAAHGIYLKIGEAISESARGRILAATVPKRLLGRKRYCLSEGLDEKVWFLLLPAFERAIFGHAGKLLNKRELESLAAKVRRAQRVLTIRTERLSAKELAIWNVHTFHPGGAMKELRSWIVTRNDLTIRDSDYLLVGYNALEALMTFVESVPAPAYPPPRFTGNSFTIERWLMTLQRWIDGGLQEFELHKDSISGRKHGGVNLELYSHLDAAYKLIKNAKRTGDATFSEFEADSEFKTETLAELSIPLYRLIYQTHKELVSVVSKYPSISALVRRRALNAISVPSGIDEVDMVQEKIRQRIRKSRRKSSMKYVFDG